MAVAHLLFGYLGAGKTTFARRLERETGAVRFTPDEWMSRLFGDDPPEEIFQAKAEAILELLQPLWARCLSRGADVVLDYGFWRRSERDHVRDLVESLGGRPVLYRLACDDAEAMRRIAARNTADDRDLYIAPATFQRLKAGFEPLGPDEAFVDASQGASVT